MSALLDIYDQYMGTHWRMLLLVFSGLGVLGTFCRKETLTDPLTALFKAVALIVLSLALNFIWSFASNNVLVFLGHPSSAVSQEDCNIIGAFGAVMAVILFNRLFRFGDLICDILYSEGSYADEARVKQLPNLKALHEYRQRGYARKTYTIARRHLWNEERAYGHWLFAAETAACYLRDFGTARRIVSRLCRCSAFTKDQKTFAIQKFRGWIASRKRKGKLPTSIAASPQQKTGNTVQTEPASTPPIKELVTAPALEVS